MKTNILFVLLSICFCRAAFAQSLDPNRELRRKPTVAYNTAAVFYPFAAITDNFRFGIEHRPSEKLGLRGVFNFGYGEDNVFYDAQDFTSFGGELQARYYPAEGNPVVYTGAYVSARNINLTRYGGTVIGYDNFGNPIYGNKEISAQAFGFGFIGGLQFEVAKVFLIDGYIGAGPNIPSGDYRSGNGAFGNGNSIWGYRKGMRYNGGLNFGVILFK